MSRMHSTSYLPALKRLAADRHGVTAIITGIALTVILGFAGLAIDVAYWLNATRGMQAAADQAAYSAASVAGTNSCSSAGAVPEAIAIVAARGYPVSGTPTTSGGTTTLTDGRTTITIVCNSSASTFKVTVAQVQPMWFTSLFMHTAPSAAADATAMLASKVSDLCVLALDGTNVSTATIGTDSDAEDVGGTATLNLHCGIADDSNSATSFSVSGSARVTATDIYLVGDDQGSPSGSATITTTPIPNNILRYQPPVADPYLGRTIPTLSSCTSPTTSGGGAYAPPSGTTLDPGTYCGGLTFGNHGGGHSDTYTLNPGVYYIVGGGTGGLTFDSSATVTGTGVTFVLTGGTPSSPLLGETNYAQLKINGGSTVTLTAPTSGATGGMVFFQDRNAPFSSNSTCGNGQAQNKINGGAGQLLTGAIYFPNQSICFTGNSATTGAGKCTQLIGRTLDFTGTSSVELSCAGTGIEPLTVLVPQLIH